MSSRQGCVFHMLVSEHLHSVAVGVDWQLHLLSEE